MWAIWTVLTIELINYTKNVNLHEKTYKNDRKTEKRSVSGTTYVCMWRQTFDVLDNGEKYTKFCPNFKSREKNDFVTCTRTRKIRIDCHRAVNG